MRISPVSFFKSANFAHKNQNINFGKFDPQHKQEIIENMPIDWNDDFTANMNINFMEGNRGIMIKLGSENDPRGKVYAELIPEHVEKSWMKDVYIAMSKKKEDYPEEPESDLLFCFSGYDSLHHLEDEKQYRKFLNEVQDIQCNEKPDGSKMLAKSDSTPIDTSSDDTDVRDASMKAYELYGV